MIDYDDLFDSLRGTELDAWASQLPGPVLEALNHGDMPEWAAALERMPTPPASSIDLDADCLRAGTPEEIDDETRGRLAAELMRFHPWRKGPFCLFGIYLDTEWRSDWKWRRIAAHVAPLSGRRILDVGCGNGYYGWRMLGAGAREVIGIDPTLRYVMQYQAISRLLGPTPNHVLPLRLEQLPEAVPAFDTVFSLGVIYHQRDPVAHLRRLKGFLRPGGELVLEGLVIEGGAGEVLVPKDRYAQMKNVHAVPSCAALEEWASQAGLTDVRIVDVTPTTTEEQRRTPWMRFHSLSDFLDPEDPAKTIEGHPAPRRAILLARRR